MLSPVMVTVVITGPVSVIFPLATMLMSGCSSGLHRRVIDSGHPHPRHDDGTEMSAVMVVPFLGASLGKVAITLSL